MKRTDADGNVANLFSNGNPIGGVEGTLLEETWFNNVQEELAFVIENQGIVLDGDIFTQLDAAITLKIINESISDHGLLAGLADDDHLQYIRVNGARAFTGNQSMGGFKLTTLGAGVAGSTDAARMVDIPDVSGFTQGDVAENIIATWEFDAPQNFNSDVDIDGNLVGALATFGDDVETIGDFIGRTFLQRLVPGDDLNENIISKLRYNYVVTTDDNTTTLATEAMDVTNGSKIGIFYFITGQATAGGNWDSADVFLEIGFVQARRTGGFITTVKTAINTIGGAGAWSVIADDSGDNVRIRVDSSDGGITDDITWRTCYFVHKHNA